MNTVIVLFSSPGNEAKAHVSAPLQKITRFVMFKVPFEHILSSIIFDEIEAANDPKSTPEYRTFPISQQALLEDGWEWPDDATEETKKRFSLSVKGSKYGGNKWGGKYLRAPDIYYTILSKGNNLMRQLSYFFNGERYLNTGGADGFFIITGATRIGNGLYHVFNNHTTTSEIPPFEGEIDQEFLVPLIKDYTKKDKRIEIQGYDAYCLVIKDKPSSRIRKYIKWGEENGYHLRSVTKNQRPWYKPTNQMTSAAKILVPRSFNDTFIIHFNPKSYLSLRFY